jgi:serine/threonine protein kinase
MTMAVPAAPSTVDSEEDALPRRFGRYLLFDKIGEGGMARIFLARVTAELGGERLVVVKEILPLLAASTDMSRLLIEEAKLCAGLSHKNIVQVTDLGRDEGRLYIAMEYVEGLDLRELLRGCSQKKVPLPVEFSLFVVCEVLRALDYAHRRRGDDGRPLGIVHRDVSPSNVLLSVEGEVKLCDFGIARILTSQGDVPDEAIQGKAGYMSPEAARGDAVDARSDVFAVGIVLWELLAGQRLYRSGAGRKGALDQAREANIPELQSRDYPDEATLFDIVARALHKSPEERYPSAQAMLEDLEGYIEEERLVASALRFGEWLVEHFGAEIVALRRERERAAKEHDESSGEQAARSFLPGGGSRSRDEQPTLPDLDAGGLSATRSSPPPPTSAPEPAPARGSMASIPPQASRRPSAVTILALVVAFIAVGVLISLFVGRS